MVEAGLALNGEFVNEASDLGLADGSHDGVVVSEVPLVF
jgi:hypothetical protein